MHRAVNYINLAGAAASFAAARAVLQTVPIIVPRT